MGLSRMARKIQVKTLSDYPGGRCQVVLCCQGRICIDGIEITERPLVQLRTFLSIIHQDTGLLSGSLRFCLDPTGRFSDHQLWQMMSYVELGLTLPAGLDTELEDCEGVITPTSRQLIILARCILSQPRLEIVTGMAVLSD